MRLRIVTTCLLVALLYFCLPLQSASAAEASAISFGAVDYENLTMQVYNNYNNVIYYSTDNSTWSELEGSYNTSGKVYSIDISWVSSSSDETLYFKGDVVKTVKSITLPMQNSTIAVDYDRVEGEFTFSEVEEADYFQWRKITDYNWNTVSLNENSSSYKSFLTTMEYMRVKGAKILIRTPQVIGTSANDVGMRPSSEVTITIPARGTAPSVKINTSKLKLSTTPAIEYYDASNDLWIECDGSMSIEDIAPKALFRNGGSSVTLLLRKSATISSAESKIQKLVIPGQTAAPTIGGSSSDVTYYYLNSKLVLQFNKASDTNIFEYAIVDEDVDYDPADFSWKQVNTTKIINLSAATAPRGCSVYVRRKGTDENASKNIPSILSSDANRFTVTY
ncbi:MAG: hypothetical protein H6Q59_2462 [Firmicutes bacterium]|nr:hypothetical protein [Bacillota bacterium]